MTVHLTEAQTAALRAASHQPLEAETANGEKYVIVSRETYTLLTSLSSEAEEEAKQTLRTLIQEGIESGNYRPADEVYRELYQIGKELRAARHS